MKKLLVGATMLAVLGVTGGADAWETYVCVRAMTPRLIPAIYPAPQRIVLTGTIGYVEPRAQHTQLTFTIKWNEVWDTFGQPLAMTNANQIEKTVSYTQIERVDCNISNN